VKRAALPARRIPRRMAAIDGTTERRVVINTLLFIIRIPDARGAIPHGTPVTDPAVGVEPHRSLARAGRSHILASITA
jgi:hypothetical protein